LELGDVLIPFHSSVYYTLAALRDGGAFNESISPNPFPVDFSAKTNLFHTSIKCPIKAEIPITPSASVSLDVATNVHASISIGAVAAGTIIPPKITEFGLDFGAFYSVLGWPFPNQ